jgi:predicted HicB family RNase H-like nuclease
MEFKQTPNKHRNINLDKAIEAVKKEEDKLFTCRISKSLHKELKAKTVTEDVSIKDVMIKLIEGYVEGDIAI